MDKLMGVGITLTILLIGISTIQTIALGIGAQSFDTGDVGPSTEQIQSVTLDTNSEISTDDYTAGVNAVASAWDGLILFLGFIFNMMFGWTTVIRAIFAPVGLEVIGTALTGLLGFIQVGTITAIIAKLVASIRGSSG